MSLRGLDAYLTTEPEYFGHGPCTRHQREDARYCWEGHDYVCADCLDDEAFEAREPLSEQDLDQIEYEIAEYDAA